MRILFVGETWKGSTARSLREAISACSGVELDEIGEDLYWPRARSWVVRAGNRLLRHWYEAELSAEIDHRVALSQPHALLVYKGEMVSAQTVKRIAAGGVATVNVFPDLSPHAHGRGLQVAIGAYDLVVSAKPFHPGLWRSTYGYHNRCVFVAHGYDPALHLRTTDPTGQDLDVVLAARWRPEYENTLTELAALLPDASISVAIAGGGWSERRGRFPSHWQVLEPMHGVSYVEFLRRGRIVIAPLSTEIVADGRRQPGEADTMRTYELAAAGCFFLHRRTDYVQSLYDERLEVPMWADAGELARLIRHYLPREKERRSMAAAAHRRAVPGYSIAARAGEIVGHVQSLISGAHSHNVSDA